MADQNNPDLLEVLRELREVSTRLQRQSHELIDTIDNSPLGRNVGRLMRVAIDGTDEKGTDSLRFIAHDNRRRLADIEEKLKAQEKQGKDHTWDLIKIVLQLLASIVASVIVYKAMGK